LKKILVVDDDVAVTNYFMVFLMQTERFEPIVENDSRKVMKHLANDHFDAMMLDLDMPNVTGMEILDCMRNENINVPVIILTGVNDIELAVKTMKRGAFDYLTKPVDDETLLEVIDRAVEHGSLSLTIDRLPSELKREDLKNQDAFSRVPAQDPEMIRLFHQAEKIAVSDLSVFIWGERGTGKEALARAIHKTSARVKSPFIAIDSGAGRPDEFSSRLFGRAKNWAGKRETMKGFLETASGGTLFLDNIEKLSLPVQVRLKRVIQTGEYYRDDSTEMLATDVRFIVASNHDLTKSEYKERFSRDLLYHLMINSIRIPPLRDHADDIPLLAEHFLSLKCEHNGTKIKGFSDDFIELLMKHSFPDNVQELQNIIASAVVNTEGDIITPEALSPYVRDKIEPGSVPGGFKPQKLLEIQREYISKTLDYCGGDRKRACDLLGISVSKLSEILRTEDTKQT